MATLQGTGVTASNGSGLWWGNPSALKLLARTNGLAPDHGGIETSSRWSRFISYALPSGVGAGPIFVASIRGPGITLKNDVGVWGVDSAGTLRQLLRTGDLVNGHRITLITAPGSVPGAIGASRGFNERGSIALRVQLAGAGSAIVQIDIP